MFMPSSSPEAKTEKIKLFDLFVAKSEAVQRTSGQRGQDGDTLQKNERLNENISAVLLLAHVL